MVKIRLFNDVTEETRTFPLCASASLTIKKAEHARQELLAPGGDCVCNMLEGNSITDDYSFETLKTKISELYV